MTPFSIVLHTKSKKATLFSPLQVFSLWLINSTKDFHKGYETHLTPLLTDGNNSVPVSGQFTPPGGILQISEDRWTESNLTLTGFGLCTDSWQVPVQTNTSVNSPSLTFDTREMTISLPGEKVQTIKVQAARVALLPTCRAVMKLLCLTNFASMVLPLARLHSHPSNFVWIRHTGLQPIFSNHLRSLRKLEKLYFDGTHLCCSQSWYIDPQSR